MVSVILDFTENNNCKVTIITGGGGEGIMAVTFGSERDINKKIVTFLEKVCKEKAWSIKEEQSNL